MLFFDILFLIFLGIIVSVIFTLGVTTVILNIIFSNIFPRIRKSIYLDDVNSINKLVDALNN